MKGTGKWRASKKGQRSGSGRKPKTWLSEQLKASGIKSWKPHGEVCILCGTRVPGGQMLGHKHEVHGEAITTKSRKRGSSEQIKTLVVSGGLPSLGKNSR